MWVNAFERLLYKQDCLEGKFLKSQIAFGGTAAGIQHDTTANVDAVMALLAHRLNAPIRMGLVHPDATAAKARQVLLAIAFAELFEHSPGKAGDTVGGILFVTQKIIQARDLLSGVMVGNQRITDVFRILPLTSADILSDWKTIYVANPGRALEGGKDLRRLRALVIDGSHPRTIMHLQQLFKQEDLIHIPLQVIIAPPVDIWLDQPEKQLLWLWEPYAVQKVMSLNGLGRERKVEAVPRHYWVAEDNEFDKCLSKVEDLFLGAIRISRNRIPAELLEGWSILTTQRSLCVQLEQAERGWRESRLGNRMRDRINALYKTDLHASGELSAYLAIHWRTILEGLTEGYRMLAERDIPEKFYVIALVLENLLEQSTSRVRIVTHTHEEAPLLAGCLTELDDRFKAAFAEGVIEVVHQREEARRAADGRYCPTILAAARSNSYRYLDLFTQETVHIVCYQSEALRDRRRLENLYNKWSPHADDLSRCRLECSLGLAATHTEINEWTAPPIIVHGELPSHVHIEPELSVEALEVEWLSDNGSGWGCRYVNGPTSCKDVAETGCILIEDVNREAIKLQSRQLVNIYRPETEKLLRVLACHVRCGDYLVVLLDDQYEALFDRLCDVIDERRPIENTLRLERWRIAKQRLCMNYASNRREIFRKLEARISVDYPAAKAWFGKERDDNGECIGPRDYKDFVEVARLTGVYRDEADLASTFQSIQQERTNRRRLGRLLRKALHALAMGNAYEQAIMTAQALETEVEEIMHAVKLYEVFKVRTVE